MNTQAQAQKIAALNDALRQRGIGGRIMMTAGIQALGRGAVIEIMNKIREFDTFSEGNDPYGERDFGSITVDGNKVFWKVDYYDRNMQYASPNPADQSVTVRVMTIMLADEY